MGRTRGMVPARRSRPSSDRFSPPRSRPAFIGAPPRVRLLERPTGRDARTEGPCRYIGDVPTRPFEDVDEGLDEVEAGTGAGGGAQRRRRWSAIAAAVPPATAPTPAAAGMPTFAAFRAVR